MPYRDVFVNVCVKIDILNVLNPFTVPGLYKKIPYSYMYGWMDA